MLRCLILAFTGDQAATVLDAAPESTGEHAALVAARQTLDRQMGAGWQAVLLPLTGYQVSVGDGL